MKKLRIEAAVRRLDWQLEGRVPVRRRREIRRDLRANLAAAADHVGDAEAVRRLGDLRRLAEEYLDAEGGRLNVRAGTYAAIAVVAVLLLIDVLVLHAFQAGFDKAGGTGPWSYSLGPFAYRHEPGEGLLFAAEIAWPALIGLPGIAFFLWSRSWRKLRAV